MVRRSQILPARQVLFPGDAAVYLFRPIIDQYQLVAVRVVYSRPSRESAASESAKLPPDDFDECISHVFDIIRRYSGGKREGEGR